MGRETCFLYGFAFGREDVLCWWFDSMGDVVPVCFDDAVCSDGFAVDARIPLPEERLGRSAEPIS